MSLLGCSVAMFVTLSGPIHHPQRDVTMGPYDSVKIGDYVGLSPMTIIGIKDDIETPVASHQESNGVKYWAGQSNQWLQFTVTAQLQCDEVSK